MRFAVGDVARITVDRRTITVLRSRLGVARSLRKLVACKPPRTRRCNQRIAPPAERRGDASVGDELILRVVRRSARAALELGASAASRAADGCTPRAA